MDFDFDFDVNIDLFEDKQKYEPKFKELEIEKDLKSDMKELIKRDFEQRERMIKQTDDKYYFIMTFQNVEQRNKYLKHFNLFKLLENNYWINGLTASRQSGIEQDVQVLSQKKFKKNNDLEII